jgi:hypothetical protein
LRWLAGPELHEVAMVLRAPLSRAIRWPASARTIQ